jgi:pyruvate/2-oxoglutarate dehydrogenase complex dihydrolipoamide acyltransferase (E2) component
VTGFAGIARQRRHTLHFLDFARQFAPVFLDTEIDMSAVRAHRRAAAVIGRRYSWVTYLTYAASRVLAQHPAANSSIAGHLRPRVARHDGVDVKLALDKRLDGERVVLGTILRDVHAATLDEIQDQVDSYRDGDPADMREYDNIRTLHRLPWPVRFPLFRLLVGSLRRRRDMIGTLAVTSLGHTAVDGFHSVGGTTVTLGVGRVVDRPVVRGTAVVAAPVLRLNLAFDHRVIDGAEAADVLTEIKAALEQLDLPAPVADGVGVLVESEAR